MSVALLPGINVGGKNLIGMQDLNACFQDAGYRDVRTYAHRGNVLFNAGGTTGPELEDAVERLLKERLDMPILVVIRSRDQLAATVARDPGRRGAAQVP